MSNNQYYIHINRQFLQKVWLGKIKTWQWPKKISCNNILIWFKWDLTCDIKRCRIFKKYKNRIPILVYINWWLYIYLLIKYAYSVTTTHTFIYLYMKEPTFVVFLIWIGIICYIIVTEKTAFNKKRKNLPVDWILFILYYLLFRVNMKYKIITINISADYNVCSVIKKMNKYEEQKHYCFPVFNYT